MDLYLLSLSLWCSSAKAFFLLATNFLFFLFHRTSWLWRYELIFTFVSFHNEVSSLFSNFSIEIISGHHWHRKDDEDVIAAPQAVQPQNGESSEVKLPTLRCCVVVVSSDPNFDLFFSLLVKRTPRSVGYRPDCEFLTHLSDFYLFSDSFFSD